MRVYDDIIAAAIECLGTKWVHQGRCIGAGIDCVGVIVHVAGSCGFAYQDVASYPRRPNGVLQRTLDNQFAVVDISDIKIGDILMMVFGGEPHHVSIYIGGDIVHSYAAVRRCIRQPYSNEWRRMTTRIYRFRELA